MLNKSELPVDDDIERELAALVAAGYRCLRVSAPAARDWMSCARCLRDQTAMLVGQSGVGKSSLLRPLVPAQRRRDRRPDSRR